MSGETLTPPASNRVVDYLRTLTPEEKELAVVELIREAIRLCPHPCLLPVTAEDGEQLGVFVPQALTAGLNLSVPSSETERYVEIDGKLLDLSRTFDVMEWLKQVSREEDEEVEPILVGQAVPDS